MGASHPGKLGMKMMAVICGSQMWLLRCLERESHSGEKLFATVLFDFMCAGSSGSNMLHHLFVQAEAD